MNRLAVSVLAIYASLPVARAQTVVKAQDLIKDPFLYIGRDITTECTEMVYFSGGGGKWNASGTCLVGLSPMALDFGWRDLPPEDSMRLIERCYTGSKRYCRVRLTGRIDYNDRAGVRVVTMRVDKLEWMK